MFLRAFLDVSEERFDSNEIGRLYGGAEYPLGRQPATIREPPDFGKASIVVPSRAAHPRMIKRIARPGPVTTNQSNARPAVQ